MVESNNELLEFFLNRIYNGYYKVDSRTGKMFYLKGRNKGKQVGSINGSGYMQMSTKIDGKYTSVLQHRVLFAYYNGGISSIVDGLVINHKDGIKSNNKSSNLEQITPKGNSDHKYENNLDNTVRGEDSPVSKFTENDILNIKARLLNGDSGYKIAKSYGVHPSTIYNIRDGKTWSHVIQL